MEENKIKCLITYPFEDAYNPGVRFTPGTVEEFDAERVEEIHNIEKANSHILGDLLLIKEIDDKFISENYVIPSTEIENEIDNLEENPKSKENENNEEQEDSKEKNLENKNKDKKV